MRRKDILCWGGVLVGTGLLAAAAAAYSFTWTGSTNDLWCGDDNWTRAGCGSPYYDCPDSTSDDAIFDSNEEVDSTNITIDDLTITNAEVRFGKYSTGLCQEAFQFAFDSVTIAPTSGNTAKLRGGACTSVSTY